jgi:murein L,D-transpeptidase YafK
MRTNRAKFSVAFLVAAVVTHPFRAWAAEDRLPADARADHVVVLKKERKLILMRAGRELKTYRIALGTEPAGPKMRLGDHRTPEGSYILDRRNARSRFYRSIHVSYPNAQDRSHAAKQGVSPGGDIFIHGLPNGYGWIGTAHRAKDWTDGCIALTNREMDEIWRAVPDGTPIDIKP